MNERIRLLALQANGPNPFYGTLKNQMTLLGNDAVEKFAELLIEAVLDEVKERAYYTGDRDWSDEVDRPWIQLEFGYGKLADAQKGIVK